MYKMKKLRFTSGATTFYPSQGKSVSTAHSEMWITSCAVVDIIAILSRGGLVQFALYHAIIPRVFIRSVWINCVKAFAPHLPATRENHPSLYSSFQPVSAGEHSLGVVFRCLFIVVFILDMTIATEVVDNISPPHRLSGVAKRDQTSALAIHNKSVTIFAFRLHNPIAIRLNDFLDFPYFRSFAHQIEFLVIQV